MTAFVMLNSIRSLSEMFHLNNLAGRHTKRRWIAVILLAVCSITISVATRYSVPGKNDSKVITVRNHVETEPARQRLLNNAASWMPPAVGSAILPLSRSFTRIAWTGPPEAKVFFEHSLFYRPPPSHSSLL